MTATPRDASPAAAIAWQFRRRHRWGLLALARLLAWRSRRSSSYCLRTTLRVDFADAETFALASSCRCRADLHLSLAVFTFGLDGDLAARQSMYPARLFTLPAPETTPSVKPGLALRLGNQ